MRTSCDARPDHTSFSSRPRHVRLFSKLTVKSRCGGPAALGQFLPTPLQKKIVGALRFSPSNERAFLNPPPAGGVLVSMPVRHAEGSGGQARGQTRMRVGRRIAGSRRVN